MRTLSALAPEPLREAPQQVKGARLTHNVIKKKKAEERAEMSGPLHLLFAGTTRRGRPHHHIVPVPHNVERVFVGMASYVAEWWQSVRSINFRQLCLQVISLAMIVTSALIIWKGLMCVTGSESPVVVVLSGSMEPGFKRGDILFLRMSDTPIQAGEIVVFNVDGREIPIVHRVIKVHTDQDDEVQVLTKGDNNYGDDRALYAQGQQWLQRHHIMGRAIGFLPYVGWVTIIMTEKPYIKYLLIAALGLLVITSKE